MAQTIKAKTRNVDPSWIEGHAMRAHPSQVPLATWKDACVWGFKRSECTRISEMKSTHALDFHDSITAETLCSSVLKRLLRTWLTPKLCPLCKVCLYFHKHLEPGFVFLV
jgi:hypothetical protein